MLVETQESQEPMLVAVVSYACLIGVIFQTDLILICKAVELLEVVS